MENVSSRFLRVIRFTSFYHFPLFLENPRDGSSPAAAAGVAAATAAAAAALASAAATTTPRISPGLNY